LRFALPPSESARRRPVLQRVFAVLLDELGDETVGRLMTGAEPRAGRRGNTVERDQVANASSSNRRPPLTGLRPSVPQKILMGVA
jgi:hypothetical protein